jgi:hypothetical protein
MAFSVFVELINLAIRGRQRRAAERQVRAQRLVEDAAE